jgi:uncharacterized protein YjiS (DUF1127 family)
LEVQIMSNTNSIGANRSLTALLSGPVRLVYERVIEPIRRHARWRGGERELARLDDRLLRDIGLTRSQVHAAAYGLVGRGGNSAADSMRASPPANSNVRLKRRAMALRVDGAMAAPLATRE